MTVEATVQKMMDSYPVLFITREECFDHLFCTIGNGYKWKWGQLVHDDFGDEGYDEEADREVNKADYEVKHKRAEPSEEALEARKKRDELQAKAGMLKGNEDVDRQKHHWFPLSKKYSKLFTVPDDVREDWKEAVEECKRMLERDGVDWKNAEM